jgi:L-2,4-diaminobutyrate decarboxylase
VNSSPLPGGALADHLISALNNNDGGVPQAALACEEEVIRAFKTLYELPDSWNGLILPGGAFTMLQGLLLARASAFPEIEVDGFHSLQGIPRIYTSEATHFTVARAAKEIGVGERNAVCVPCTGRGSIDVLGLEEHIRAFDPGVCLPSACERRQLWGDHSLAVAGDAAGVAEAMGVCRFRRQLLTN